MFNLVKYSLMAVVGVTTAGAVFAAANPEAVPGIKEQFAPLIFWLADMWKDIASNPLPVLSALATFAVTVAYYKFTGKSFREALETAATRVTVISAPAAPAAPVESENPLVVRAKHRATRTQLVFDQTNLEGRMKSLPAELKKAEVDFAHTERDLAEANKILEQAQAAHAKTTNTLAALRKEDAEAKGEMEVIVAEIKALEAKV